MSDPFEALASPTEPQRPRPQFARELRARLAERLGLDPDIPTIELPHRRPTMSDTTATTDEHVTASDRPGTGGGIWAGVFYDDALAGIRFLVDVFGFEEQLVVTAPDGETVVHSQLRWPEGGIVQAGTYEPDDVFCHPPGAQSLYVVTADPHAVWERSQAAGLEVVRPPEEPAYDPGGMGFTVRDPEGNIWSFGGYGLGADA